MEQPAHQAGLQVGIALVGTSSLLSGEGSATRDVSPRQMLTGMALIVASQVSSGARLLLWCGSAAVPPRWLPASC